MVEKALDLIDILSEEIDSPSLHHLADRLELTRNRTFRLLATLEARGLVEKDPRSGFYSLALPAAEMAHKILRNINLIKIAHPVMENLARKHDEAVYMTVLSGDDVLFLDMVDSTQQVKATPLIGRRFPFFTNAAGKAIRALDSWELVEKLYKRSRKQVPDRLLLESELKTIRSSGVAVDMGGLGDGITSVAVAVRDYAGKVVGALTVLGPSFRIVSDRLDNEIIPSLVEGGEALSLKLGFMKF
ncbi:MAG TPA: IclR family transcriptional regulator [Verrucomicrobiae bacterium]|nr:IclR family transcriptional regulator [Verrucomicrobiae bacterium]